MHEVTVFKNPEFGSVRTLVIDGEPWFVGKDVAERLGYSNPSKAVIRHVDKEDKCFDLMRVSDSQNGNLVKTAIKAQRDMELCLKRFRKSCWSLKYHI